MRYTEYKSAIHRALCRHPAGLTWDQLQKRFALPYDRPCPAWTKQLEQDIKLSRTKGPTRALVWKLRRRSKSPA